MSSAAAPISKLMVKGLKWLNGGKFPDSSLGFQRLWDRSRNSKPAQVVSEERSVSRCPRSAEIVGEMTRAPGKDERTTTQTSGLTLDSSRLTKPQQKPFLVDALAPRSAQASRSRDELGTGPRNPHCTRKARLTFGLTVTRDPPAQAEGLELERLVGAPGVGHPGSDPRIEQARDRQLRVTNGPAGRGRRRRQAGKMPFVARGMA